MNISPNCRCPECEYFEEYDAHLHINGNHCYCTYRDDISNNPKHSRREPKCIDGYFRSNRKCEHFNG